MDKTVITRFIVVTIANKNLNTYGDLIFTDAAGTEYKLGKKREKYFGAIQPGKTVKLSYAEYMQKEYIAEVALAEPTQPLQKKYNPTTPPVQGAEKGMLIKEIGDNFRAKLFTPATHPDLWAYYAGELSKVGVKVN